MKIAILNQPLANRGDEAAHKAFVRTLAHALPEAQIDVIFLYAQQELVDAMDVHEENVRYIILPPPHHFMYRPVFYSLLLRHIRISFLHPSLHRFKKVLSKYDRVICAPGGICMGGFMDWMHVWQLLVAKVLKKPIFYWGRSIGPFSEETYKKKVFKKYSYELLHYFSYISLRDTKSVDIAKAAGLNVDEVVDSAFLETPTTQIPEIIQTEIANNDYIVFVPNELTWHFRYKNVPQDRIDNFYLKLLDIIVINYPNAKIVMLPQTYKSIINDYGYFEKLKHLSKNQNIIVVDEEQNSDIQQTIIAGAKLVVGARYHSIVFAINNNIPFISLSYEHKMSGLLEKLNMTENMLEIQDIFDSDDGEERNNVLEGFSKLIGSIGNNVDSRLAKQIIFEGFENFISKVK